MAARFIQEREQPETGAVAMSKSSASRRNRIRTGLLAIFPIVLLTIFSGCRASRSYVLRSATRDSLITEKTVNYTEKLRDTVIYITLPMESHANEVKRDSSFLQTSLAFSTASVLTDGTLRHSLKNKPGPVAAGVSLPEKQTVILTSERSANNSVSEIPVNQPLGGIEKFLMYSGMIAWGAAAGALLVFLIRLFR